MPLPQEFVKRNLEKAEGFKMFGVPMEELTRKELIACVIAGFNTEKIAIKECSRQRKFLMDLRA